MKPRNQKQQNKTSSIQALSSDASPQIFRAANNIYKLKLGKVFQWNTKGIFISIPFNKPIIEILPGYDHVVFKNIDGKFYISGTNYCRTLVNDKEEGDKPLPIINKINGQIITHIIPSHRRNFIRTADNIWYACGDNYHGELGMGKYSSAHRIAYYLFQINLPDNEQIKWITPGKYNTFFQSHSGKWYCCGSVQAIGVLDAYPFDTHKPIPFKFNERTIIKILLGDDFGVLLNNLGEIYGWGTDQNSQLSSPSLTPTKIHIPNTMKIVSINITNNQLFICDQNGIWYSSKMGNCHVSNYLNFNEEFSKYKQLYKQFYEPSAGGILQFFPPEITMTNIYKKLQFQDLKKLQLTSRFFAHTYPHLREETMNRPQIFCTGNGTIYALYKFRVFELKENGKFIPITLRSKKLIIDIKTGYDHIILKDINGKFHLKGSTLCQELINPQPENKKIFSIITHMSTEEEIIDIVPGEKRNFVCTVRNEWYACGENSFCELGVKSHFYQPMDLFPVTLPDNEKIKLIVTGKNNTFFQAHSGKWYYCGKVNANDVFNINTSCTTPIRFKFNKHHIIKIVIGDDFSVLLNNQGELYGWGSTKYNVLNTSSSAPISFCLNNVNVKDMVVINNRIFICDHKGVWYGRGKNDKGQLGRYEIKAMSEFLPIILTNNKRIVKIIGGVDTTLFLDEVGNWHYCGMIGNEQQITPRLLEMNFIPTEINSVSLKK